MNILLIVIASILTVGVVLFCAIAAVMLTYNPYDPSGTKKKNNRRK